MRGGTALAALDAALHRLVRPLVGLLARTGVTPSGLTLASLIGNGGVAYLIAVGQLPAAGLALLLVNALDLLDGELARTTGRATDFGALLDSVCDRYAELLVFFGLLLWYGQSGDVLGQAATFLALGGSTMVSYTRARAEGLGYRGDSGLLGRLERILLLALGLLVPPLLPWSLGAMLVLTNVTAVQRLLDVRRQTSR